jgi:hypothetical protein
MPYAPTKKEATGIQYNIYQIFEILVMSCSKVNFIMGADGGVEAVHSSLPHIFGKE